MSQVNIIVLAAGKGKRMKSDLPKVLVPFMGKPMIKHVLDNSKDFCDKITVVVGYKKDLVANELNEYNVQYVHQKEQLGTGHAVLVTEDKFKDFTGDILVLFGDSPLISKNVIKNLIKFHQSKRCVASILTKDSKYLGGCARIVRNENGSFNKSIEFKDLTKELEHITEINIGVMIFNSKVLFDTLKKVTNNNSQNEYYLPDVINILSRNNQIGVFKTNQVPDLFSFNTIEDLREAERLTQIYTRGHLK